jgi:ASC-1-like (ASCH) protein
MKTIIKKINPESFNAIGSGNKKCELRLNDEEINEGDVLVLREWNPEKQEYTGRELSKTITFAQVLEINNLYWSEEEIREKGLRLMSFE